MRSNEQDAVLASRTSFGIGGRADRLFRPRRGGDAQKLMDLLCAEGRRPRILGGGTNLLVDDEGIRGPIVSTELLSGCRRLSGGRIRAGAGFPLPRLVARAASWGLSGLEFLAGIPGTIGGAVFMNAGGRGRSISEAVEAVDLAVPGEGIVRRSREETAFSYRRAGLGDALVLSATFRLEPAEPEAVRRRTRETLWSKRESQPLQARSAGCFFRNVGRIPAGLLIDKAGLKGTRIGGAMVSTVHANFLVNVDGARASDVLRLARFVRETVESVFGVRLQAEVKYWKSAPAGREAPGRATGANGSEGGVAGRDSERAETALKSKI